MRWTSALFVLASAVTLHARPELAFFGVSGPRNTIPGQNAYLVTDFAWIDASEFSVDPETNTLYVPGHTLKNGDSVRVFWNQPLPNPLSIRKGYTVSNVDGDRLKLIEYAGGPVIKLTEPVSGSGYPLIGRKLDFKASVYLEPVQTDLPGVSVECQCTLTATKRIYSYWGGAPFNLKIKVAPDAPVGTTTLRFVISANEFAPQTIEIPFAVREFNAIPLAKPTEFPPIPNKDKWEKTMVRLADRWCKDQANPTDVMSFGVENQVWFYDGAWVYYQIADYTGDSKWKKCGDNIASQYLTYVTNNKGAIPGYRIFVDGLRRASRESDQPYLNAIEMLALNSPYSRAGGHPSDSRLRETAYVLETQLMYREVGKAVPQMDKTVDLLLGIFDTLFVSEHAVYNQTFMNGLGMRALIRYYEQTQDPRIPVAIKTALDWIWNHAWVPDSKRLMYSPFAYGPVCLSGCKSQNTDLINLVAPAYAWYWSITADEEYRIRGDELFAHALDNEIAYSGKIFSQNYCWSFDYVRWREGLDRDLP